MPYSFPPGLYFKVFYHRLISEKKHLVSKGMYIFGTIDIIMTEFLFRRFYQFHLTLTKHENAHFNAFSMGKVS